MNPSQRKSPRLETVSQRTFFFTGRLGTNQDWHFRFNEGKTYGRGFNGSRLREAANKCYFVYQCCCGILGDCWRIWNPVLTALRTDLIHFMVTEKPFYRTTNHFFIQEKTKQCEGMQVSQIVEKEPV